MPPVELSFATKQPPLTVRRFSIREAISRPFEVDIVAHVDGAEASHVDLDAIVGSGAALTVISGLAHSISQERIWSGVCSRMEQLQAQEVGLTTYALRIVPALWRTTLRRNNRIFQQMSLPEIALELLSDWEILPVLRLESVYPKHEYRVQYGETDYVFFSRILEEAGISFYFLHPDGSKAGKGSELTQLVLTDVPGARGELRPGTPLTYVDNPNASAEQEFVTKVALAQEMRPGRMVVQDFDFRTRADTHLLGRADEIQGASDELYEHYEYAPGLFVVVTGRGGDTPSADIKGIARFDATEAKAVAQRALDAERSGRRRVRFQTNVVDLGPGALFSMENHLNKDLEPEKKNRLLVVASTFDGSPNDEWTITGEAVFAAEPFRPARRTPKPRVAGVQSAIVVGPSNQEIHTDEFGRIRVQFHWDRKGKFDDNSSCWIRVSQAWAGSKYGFMAIPRVGQEVLVGFFDGDPDLPVVVGRVYNKITSVPFTLPGDKTRSGWRSDSSPGSNGYNELTFEDANGLEEVHIQAQRNLSEVVKNDQVSTVLRNRSADVTGADSTTVGGSQSFSVGANQSHTIGLDQRNNVVGQRISVVGGADAVDAGESHSATVGPGVGYVITKDKTITVTNGFASLVITPDGLFLDAKGNLTIRADGLLKLCGGEVQIDGGPNVLINTTSKAAAEVPALAAAKPPAAPGGPGTGGDTSAQAEKLSGGGTVDKPGGFEDVTIESKPPGLEQLVTTPPLSPSAAPSQLQLDGGAAQMIRQSVQTGGPAASFFLVKDEATQAISLYQLAKGESVASLPSTLQVFGPVMTKVVPGLGDLSGADIGGLVNWGNSAGIFHVGGGNAPVSSFLALRTSASPPSVNGSGIRDQSRVFENEGMGRDEAFAKASSAQGVAVYKGDSSGCFTKIRS